MKLLAIACSLVAMSTAPAFADDVLDQWADTVITLGNTQHDMTLSSAVRDQAAYDFVTLTCAANRSQTPDPICTGALDAFFASYEERLSSSTPQEAAELQKLVTLIGRVMVRI